MCRYPLFVALCDYNPPTLQTDRRTSSSFQLVSKSATCTFYVVLKIVNVESEKIDHITLPKFSCRNVGNSCLTIDVTFEHKSTICQLILAYISRLQVFEAEQTSARRPEYPTPPRYSYTVKIFAYPRGPARTSLFRRFTNTNAYVAGSVKIRKTRHKLSVDVRTISTVQLQQSRQRECGYIRTVTGVELKCIVLRVRLVRHAASRDIYMSTPDTRPYTACVDKSPLSASLSVVSALSGQVYCSRIMTEQTPINSLRLRPQSTHGSRARQFYKNISTLCYFCFR